MIDKENIVSVEKIYLTDNICRTYKIVYDTDKECFVPLDETNTDYQEIQEWISLGNTVIDNPQEETP